jgi:hypothetical protein
MTDDHELESLLRLFPEGKEFSESLGRDYAANTIQNQGVPSEEQERLVAAYFRAERSLKKDAVALRILSNKDHHFSSKTLLTEETFVGVYPVPQGKNPGEKIDMIADDLRKNGVAVVASASLLVRSGNVEDLVADIPTSAR